MKNETAGKEGVPPALPMIRSSLNTKNVKVRNMSEIMTFVVRSIE